MTSSAFLKLSGNVRIGELLVQAGMLTKAQLQEATRHAGAKRLQIGQILVMYGYVTAKDLQSALAAQSMVRDRSLDIGQAVRSLKVAYKTGSRFEDVVSSQELAGTLRSPTGKLGELLLDAGVISSEQFLKCMDKSLTTGLPLGRTLVLENALSEDLLTTALDVQVRLRDQMYTREEAVQNLQAAAGVAPVEGAKPHDHPMSHRPGVRLGELMVLAGVVSATDVLNSVEWALVNQQPLGEVLVSQGFARQDMVDNALALQKLMQERVLDSSQAAECLALINSANISLTDAVNQVKAEQAQPAKASLDYAKLLTLARVVTHDDIAAALDMTLNEPKVLGKLLVATGFITESAMNATLECLRLLSEGALSQDDAVVALDFCLHRRGASPLVFKDALKDLGWKPGDTTAGARKETATPAAIASVQPVAAPPAPVASAGTQSFAPPEPADIDDFSDIPDDVEPADIAEEPELESNEIEVEGIEAADELVSADEVANAAEPVEKDNLVAEGRKTNHFSAQQPPTQRMLPEIHEEREGMLEIFELDAQQSLSVPVEAFVSSPPAVTMPPQPAPIPLPPAAPPTPPGKGRKFVDTIAPEDSRGTELADLMTQMKGGGGFLEKTARGDQRNFLFDSYNRLAEGYTETGNYKEAQLVYERILVLRLHDLGPNHVDLVTDFRNLAGVLCTQEKFDRAEPFLRRAVSILETAPDQELSLADSMMFLANIYLRQSKFSECEPLLRKSLQIRERLHPLDHMEIADTMFDFARLYRKTGKIVESELMYTRAKEILAKNQARDAW